MPAYNGNWMMIPPHPRAPSSTAARYDRGEPCSISPSANIAVFTSSSPNRRRSCATPNRAMAASSGSPSTSVISREVSSHSAGERSARLTTTGPPSASPAISSGAISSTGVHSPPLRGARRVAASGMSSSNPTLTPRLSHENVVSVSETPEPKPAASSVAIVEGGSTLAIDAAEVMESGADPDRPPCHTMNPANPQAAISG